MLEGFATVRTKANGVGLHVVHGGSGPAMLLLHGYPQTHTKRPGWQTGAKLDMLATWRERAEWVCRHGLGCGHLVPEERPRAVVVAMLDFYSEITGKR